MLPWVLVLDAETNIFFLKQTLNSPWHLYFKIQPPVDQTEVLLRNWKTEMRFNVFIFKTHYWNESSEKILPLKTILIHPLHKDEIYIYRYDPNQPTKDLLEGQGIYWHQPQSISSLSLPLYLYISDHVWPIDISLPVAHCCHFFLIQPNKSGGCDIEERALLMEIRLGIEGQGVQQLDLSTIFSSIKWELRSYLKRLCWGWSLEYFNVTKRKDHIIRLIN